MLIIVSLSSVPILNSMSSTLISFCKYFPINDQSSLEEISNYSNYIINPGETYSLIVNHEIGSVIATTKVPSEMNISSADLGDYNCPDGEILSTENIDVNNLENLSFQQLIEFYQDPDRFITESNINVDSVIYLTKDRVEKTIEGRVLDDLSLKNVCCRRHMLTHVDIE